MGENMEKILVSACLLGKKTRYDGKDNYIPSIEELAKHFEIIPICPEVEGGLPTPRLPSEILDGKVINVEGEDNTAYFLLGAKEALKKAKKYGIRYAILKAKSPSCGVSEIYDGTFTHTLKKGDGMTAALLKEAGVTLYNETNFRRLFEDEKK